jgi:hypothetical protein
VVEQVVHLKSMMLIGLCLSLPLAFGCGGERVFDISGTVSFGTEKIAEGTITFEHSDSKETYQTHIKADGSYGVRVPSGSYKIFVEPLMVDESGVSDAGKVYKLVKNIPEVYRASHTTPLNAKVDLSQKLDFDLKK